MTTTLTEVVERSPEPSRRVERRRRAERRRRSLSTGGLALLCGVLTAAVAAPAMTNDPFRDEAVTANFASRSLGEVWSTILSTDACHAAFNLLVSALPVDFGSYLQLRLTALVPVVLAGMVMTVWGARRLGLAAALLVALTWPLMPATLGIGTYARDYGLVLLCAVVASLLLVDLLAAPVDEDHRWRWVAYAAAIVALGLFGSLALLLVVAHGFAALVVAGRSRLVLLKRWFVAAAGAGLVLLAPLALVASQPTPNSWVKPTMLTDIGTVTVRLLGGASYGTEPPATGAVLAAWAVLALCVAAVTLGIVRWRRGGGVDHRGVAVLVGASWLVVPVVANLLYSLASPIFVARYLWFVTPAAVLLFATLVPAPAPAGSNAPSRRLRMVLPALLVPLLILVVGWGPRDALQQGGRTADYVGVVSTLQQQSEPGDVIVLDLPSYLYDRSGLLAAARGPLPVDDVLVERSAVQARDISVQEFAPEQWPSVLQDADRVWVLAGGGSGVGGREAVAATGRDLVQEQPVGGYSLRLYERGQGDG